MTTPLSCGGGRPPEDASQAALRTPALPLADPTLHPARLVPLRDEDEKDKSFGTEPGGGKRMLVSGVRVVRLAAGGMQSATDPLPSVPTATVEVPERLGGGFLFVIGPVIWRADRWLAPLKMIYAAPLAPQHLFVGLDRAYVRLPNGAFTAFDARTGTPMDLGPWPGSPEVTQYVAADGWRAVAIADMQGVAAATFDAGAKWRRRSASRSSRRTSSWSGTPSSSRAPTPPARRRLTRCSPTDRWPTSSKRRRARDAAALARRTTTRSG